MKRILTAFAVSTIAFISCKKDKKAPPTAPVVTTAAVTNITINSAIGGGSIVSDGGAAVTKSGVVWSLNNNTPTFKDSIVAGTTANGVFTSNILGLDFNRTYYVRAFAINSVDTAFGTVISFTTTIDTSKVRFTYNGQEVTYGIIVSPTTGKKWLDRNLGAKRAATAKDDYQAYGDLFQWGRPADGHQLINWTASNAGAPVNGTTTTLSTTDVPGHSNLIIAPVVTPYTMDWRSDNNINRWATNSQGPCPAGWHVPTKEEWKVEFSNQIGGTSASGGIMDVLTGYSMLKLTTAGRREGWANNGSPGSITGLDGRGFYWCSSNWSQPSPFSSLGNSFCLQDAGGDSFGDETKSMAFSVRCIKN